MKTIERDNSENQSGSRPSHSDLLSDNQWAEVSDADTQPVGVQEEDHRRRRDDENSTYVEKAPSQFDVEEDFMPLFTSSFQAAAITLILQFLIPAFLALQMGVTLEFRLWKRFLPHFVMEASYTQFVSIVMWSAIITAVVLATFSIMAFLRKRRLQVQMGRLCAWLDIALMGGILLIRSHWFDDLSDPKLWMWVLVVVGISGFVIGSALIWAEDEDYRNSELAKKKYSNSIRRNLVH